MSRLYDANHWSNQLRSHRKYLIPKAAFIPWLATVPAPNKFLHLSNLDAENASMEFTASRPKIERIDIRFLCEQDETSSGSKSGSDKSACRPPGNSKHFVMAVQDGVWRSLCLPEIPETLQTLYAIEDGQSVGRNCLLATTDGYAVRETAFLQKHGVGGPRHFRAIDTRGWIHRRRGNLTARRRIPAPQRLPGVAFALNNCSCHNFYHWLSEVAPRIVAASHYERSVDYWIVDHQRPFQQWILQTLGTRPEQWIQPHCKLTLQADTMLWCNEPNEGMLREFAKRLRTSLQLNDPHEQKIYITRKQAAHRNLEGEEELICRMQLLGYEIVDFEAIPVEKQIAWVASASHIVTVHGAALAHLMFAKPGTRVVEIFPEGRKNWDLYPNKSRMFALDHRLVLARSTKHGQRLAVNIEDIESAISPNLLLSPRPASGRGAGG